MVALLGVVLAVVGLWCSSVGGRWGMCRRGTAVDSSPGIKKEASPAVRPARLKAGWGVVQLSNSITHCTLREAYERVYTVH